MSDLSSDVCSSDLAFRALVDVNDFRNAYAQQLGDIDLQAARSVHAFLSSFDDHEIRNDWVSDIDNWKLGLNVHDPEAASPERLAERRVGKDGASTCRSCGREYI